MTTDDKNTAPKSESPQPAADGPPKRKPCPEAQAHFLSRLTYHWMTSLIWMGYKRPLEHEDLYDLVEKNQSRLLADEFEARWKHYQSQPRQSNESPNVRVFPVLFDMFGWRYLAFGLLHLVQAATNIASPVIIGLLTAFVENTQQSSNPPPLWLGMVYAVVFFLLQLISTLALNKYFHYSIRTGMRVRACLTIASYRKMMKLDGLARQKFTSGQILNIISSDLSRVEMFVMQGAYMWSGPLQIITILSLLIWYIGPSALAGFGLLLVMIPVQAVIFMRLAMLRRDVAGITDSRIRQTQEFLQGIRIIKFFAWEEKFIERLMSLRSKEVDKVKYVNMWTAVLMGISTSIPVFASVISFIVYAATGNKFEAPKIFAALALFNMMRFPLILLPSVIRMFVESKVAMRRLYDFLNAGELQAVDQIGSGKEENGDVVVEIRNGSFLWEVLEEELKAKGKDGKDKGKDQQEGKSKLQQEDKPKTSAPTSPKEPTPQKDNEMELKSPQPRPSVHLKNVNIQIKKGQLVGVIGAVGSGKTTLLNALLGEIKRVSGEVHVNGNIGYAPQQPWIQNGTLRENVIFGNKYDEAKYNEAIHASALEKDLEWLPGGSDTLLGEKGIQASGGQRARVSLARIVYCSPDVVLLDDPLSAVDVHVGKHIFKHCIKKALKDKTVVLVTHHLNYLREFDYILFMKDGEVSEQGTYDELMSADQECARVIKSYAGSDNVDGDPTKKEEEGKADKTAAKVSNKMLEEERVIGAVSPEVYREYIGAAGGTGMLVAVLFITVLAQCARVGNDFWLTVWTSDMIPELDDAAYSGIYFAWGATAGLSTSLLGAILSFAFALASCKFHQDAVHGIFRAPITFFDTTPLGRIVNRFSRDTDTMDNQLPMTMQMFLSIFSGLIATLALIAYGTRGWMLVPLAPLLLVYWFMQRLYMRNSREMKRLESISRSPVYAHFGESMTGLSTVRAYNRQQQFRNKCEQNVDGNNKVVYMQLLVQRWLGLRLEILGAFICFFAALFSILSSKTLSADIVGLTLSYALQVTGSLNFAVRQAVEVEVNANSIERLHYYAKKLEQEAEYNVKDCEPPNDWPTDGEIKVRDFTLKYNASGPAVLKNINVHIRAKEKVGIVGRTGAGKSTVTLGLFRMLEPASGMIILDDLDITKIGLHDLRSRLAIIPQDAILFSGTVRTNLDPFDQYLDLQIWDVLGSVNMKEAISKLKEGLEAKVEPNGENFSSGQRQLLCLARAMLRKPRVLIMDEATANVDMESDQLIQVSLRKDFKHSTILTIAHRLNTVIDYDRILVLDQGEVVEFDSPMRLLEKKDGTFARMVEITGPNSAALLRKLAAEKEANGNVEITKVLSVEVLSP